MKTVIEVRLSKAFLSTAANLMSRKHDITAHELFRDGFVYAHLPTVSIQITNDFLGEDKYVLTTEPASTQTAVQHMQAIMTMKAQLEGFGCSVTIW
uniref:Uncharacterized protein n=1 Tax=Klebsiella phage vB_Kpn2-P2 TaxID=3230849 RepID=A0AAU8EEL5_9VIRU